MRPRVLIPVGYGLNCEEETAYAYSLVNADADNIHINVIIEKPKMIRDYQIIDFIGGFADGDHISAGIVHANRLRYGLEEELMEFIDHKKLIIGVCNGFQVLVKAGLLPGFDNDYKTQRITLTYNNSGKFEDRWVYLKVNEKSNCIWVRGLRNMYLPVRHGEGKFRASEEVLNRLEDNNQIVMWYVDPLGNPTMQYPYNPNGSDRAIAGICDPSGRIFGKMPHSEAFLSSYLHPHWTRLKIKGRLPEAIGIKIRKNGVEYVKDNLI